MDLDDNEIQDCSIEFQGDSLHGVYEEHPRQNTEDEIPADQRAYRGAVVLMADSYDLLEDRVRSLELYVQSYDEAIQNMDTCLERDSREIVGIRNMMFAGISKLSQEVGLLKCRQSLVEDAVSRVELVTAVSLALCTSTFLMCLAAVIA